MFSTRAISPKDLPSIRAQQSGLQMAEVSSCRLLQDFNIDRIKTVQKNKRVGKLSALLFYMGDVNNRVEVVNSQNLKFMFQLKMIPNA